MRTAILLVLALALCGGALEAQTPPAPSAPPAAAKAKGARPPADGKDVANNALAECLRIWDAATHMTRQEWATTCKRVQNRLDSVRVENVIVPDKAGRAKRTTRQ
jgi:hypothetical protein